MISHGQGPETEKVYICSPSGRRLFTFPEGPEGYAYSFLFSGLTFAGDRAAALAFAWGFQTPHLWVIDLTSDRVLYRKVLPRDAAHPETLEVSRIVLRRNGSAAWTQLFADGSCNVLERTSHGTKVLDGTHQAVPTSLTLSGSTVHWLELNGKAHSAALL